MKKHIKNKTFLFYFTIFHTILLQSSMTQLDPTLQRNLPLLSRLGLSTEQSIELIRQLYTDKILGLRPGDTVIIEGHPTSEYSQDHDIVAIKEPDSKTIQRITSTKELLNLRATIREIAERDSELCRKIKDPDELIGCLISISVDTERNYDSGNLMGLDRQKLLEIYNVYY